MFKFSQSFTLTLPILYTEKTGVFAEKDIKVSFLYEKISLFFKEICLLV